ncbi:WD40-repeat-containing domain protein [Melampsora americana]|nr:WD40-repeat-containing domain protein [Melampsora americana]
MNQDLMLDYESDSIGSYIESYSENHINSIIIPATELKPIAKAIHPYPTTSIDFSPIRLSESLQASSAQNSCLKTREMLATSSECIRLWDFAHSYNQHPSSSLTTDGSSGSSGYQLVLRSQMANSKADYSAPLTSFSWSQLDPSLIVTSSIDTTCTVWDISSSSAITQLIAHDREVYDVCWSTSSREIFASVGADGSVRIFDLRSLDHSTILFESESFTSHRLKFNPIDPNYIAVSSASGNDIHLLDVRSPGVPVVELKAHASNVNGLAWSPDGNLLGSCGDDCQVLIWDFNELPNLLETGSSNPTTKPNPSHHPKASNPSSNTTTHPIKPSNNTSNNHTLHTKLMRDPLLGYHSLQEINSITWSLAHRDWLAISMGKKVRCLRV